MTESEQSHDTSANAPASPPPNADEIDALLGDLVQVGRMWAGHGLTVGRLALEHSARTLELTAGALGQLARHLSGRRES